MDMASKNSMLSIELTERLIKVSQTVQRKNSVQILNGFMFLTPEGAVQDGQLQNMEALTATIQSQLTQHGIKAKKVVFSLSSGRVASREVLLPPIKEARIKAMVEANASEYFPVDISKYHITYTLLERVETGENQGNRVLVFAVPLALLESYFLLADKLGLEVAAVDYSGNSQFRMVESIPAAGTTMYVDVGANSATVTVVKEHQLLLQRTFACGGEELVYSYLAAAKKSDTDFIEALEAISGEAGKDALRKKMEESEISEALSRLLTNIVRIADYYNSNNWETPVEKIVLMGACSYLAGLSEHVSQAAGLPTEILQSAPNATMAHGETTIVGVYLSCIGAGFHPVDFMPPQFVRTKKKERKTSDSMTLPLITLAGAILISGALVAVSLLNYRAALSEKTEMEQQIEQLAAAEQTYQDYLLYEKGVSDFSALAASIESPNEHLVAFIEELEKKMPREITVLSAVCTQTDVSMNISVPDKASAAKVLVALRTFESLQTVSTTAFTDTADENGIVSVDFSVRCEYGENPYLQNLNPHADTDQAFADAQQKTNAETEGTTNDGE